MHLAIAWSGMYEGNGTAISSWLDVIASKHTKDAMRVARDCTQPTLCWIFADRDGHIGLQSCGRIPQRGGGHIGLTPIPAWDEANHWQGWVASELLPNSYDPPEGFLATANEEKNLPGMPMLVTQPLNDYRKRRICERLAELPQATCADMQTLQYDLISLQARDLLEVFLPHLPDGRVKEALSKWDFSYAPNSTGASLLRLITMVRVFVSTDRILSVADTLPLR